MKVKFGSKGGFENAIKWFSKVSSIPNAVVKNAAIYGDDRLRQGTPVDSGETALGWEHRITTTPTSVEVAWINKAHPESSVNIAAIIETGHGTKNGGYVPPRPYIKQSVAPVWKKLDNDIKGMMK